MSNIPNLGEYGYISPVTDLKTVVSKNLTTTKGIKKQSSVTKPDSIISSNKLQEEIVENRFETDESEVDILEEDSKFSKKYFVYFIKGLLLILVGFFIYWILKINMDGNRKTKTPPLSVYDYLPIQVEVEQTNRNTNNPFLKNRVGSFPNSPNFGWNG